MVNVDNLLDVSRFPWTYKTYVCKDALDHEYPIYRVRLDLLIVENRDSLTLFDIHFFSQQDDFLNNYQLAIECGFFCQSAVTYITVTPSSFPKIYEEINHHELLCASHQSI